MKRLPVLILAAFGVLAVGMSLAAPPMIGADEFYHWQRAIQVSSGALLADKLGPNEWGGPIDLSAFNLQIEFFKVYAFPKPLSRSAIGAAIDAINALPPGRTILVPFPSTASFSPLAYLPQAVGLWLGWALQFDILQQTYSARLANLGTYLALIAVIVRVLPYGATAIVLVGCIPAALSNDGTLSADPMNFTLPVLLVALVLRCRGGAGPLSRPQRYAVLGLSLALALLKPTLVVVVPVVALIPTFRFSNVRNAWAFKAACVGGAVALAAAWNAAYPFVPGIYWQTGADPAAALASFRADPMAALSLLARTIDDQAVLWCHDVYGRFGGHAAPYYFQNSLTWLDSAGLAGILATALLVEPARRRDLVAAAWLLLLGAGSALIILCAFAVGFTRPGAEVILGIQGRYFLVPAALLALSVSSARLGAWVPRRAAYAAPAVSTVLGLGLCVYAIIRFRAYWTA